MVTRLEIAKLAGVSVATVSRVTSGVGYVSRETREKVEKIIREINYIPNKMATNLSQNKSNIVAVLVEDLTNQYYLQILDSMSHEAKKQGRIISMFPVNELEIDSVVENLISNRVCAIINLALFPFSQKYIKLLNQLNICTVNIGAEGDNRLHLDYESGMREMFECLSQMNKKKLAYIAGMPRYLAEHDGRFKFYNKFVKEFGFYQSEDLIFFGEYPKKGGFEVGYELTNQLLNTVPDINCIFCMNDIVALGTINALHNHNIRIPEDISVIGCDDIMMARYTYPSLASLDMEKKEQGRVYMQAIEEENSKKEFVFHSKLVVRDSLCKKK